MLHGVSATLILEIHRRQTDTAYVVHHFGRLLPSLEHLDSTDIPDYTILKVPDVVRSIYLREVEASHIGSG